MRKRIVALLAAVPLAVAAEEGAAPIAGAPIADAQPAPPEAATAPPAPRYFPPPPASAPPAPQFAPPAPPPGPPAPGAPARPARSRDTWYIGFGVGSGDGTVNLDSGRAGLGELVFSGRTSVALSFRAGLTVSPRLLVGFDGGLVASAAEQDGHTSRAQLGYYDAGVMFFPWERGPFLRGGVGLGAFAQEVDDRTVLSARGANAVAGVGYAFWLGRAFNLTLNLDGQAYAFREERARTAWSWSAWVGCDWY